jgi:hypothetical protein
MFEASKDAALIGLVVTAIILLGATITFLILWRITIEDRNAVWQLYYDAAGIDPSDQFISEDV